MLSKLPLRVRRDSEHVRRLQLLLHFVREQSRMRARAFLGSSSAHDDGQSDVETVVRGRPDVNGHLSTYLHSAWKSP